MNKNHTCFLHHLELFFYFQKITYKVEMLLVVYKESCYNRYYIDFWLEEYKWKKIENRENIRKNMIKKQK